MAAPSVVVVRRHLDPARCAALCTSVPALPLDWQRGRQGSGYDKASLLDRLELSSTIADVVAALVAVLGAPPAVDAWWIVYPPGSGIPAHTDPAPVDGFVHLRANLVVSQGEGGFFVADGVVVDLDVGDLVVFRPDVVEHAVTTVSGRPRHVVSVGTIWPLETAAELLQALEAMASPVSPT